MTIAFAEPPGKTYAVCRHYSRFRTHSTFMPDFYNYIDLINTKIVWTRWGGRLLQSGRLQRTLRYTKVHYTPEHVGEVAAGPGCSADLKGHGMGTNYVLMCQMWSCDRCGHVT